MRLSRLIHEVSSRLRSVERPPPEDEAVAGAAVGPEASASAPARAAAPSEGAAAGGDEGAAEASEAATEASTEAAPQRVWQCAGPRARGEPRARAGSRVRWREGVSAARRM
nr:uncharacterized protein LOC113828223 [Penaeus vannamei]